MPTYRATDRTEARIEQAIAFGHTLDWICDHIGCEPRLVDRVLRRMDEAVGGIVSERPKRRRVTV